MIIYAVDDRYPSGWRVAQTRWLIRVTAVMTIQQIVAEIKSRVTTAGGGYNSIRTIILAGHGNAGYVQLGTGLTIAEVPHFTHLRNFMTPTPAENGIEIHGCGVASASSILGNGSTITNPICVSGMYEYPEVRPGVRVVRGAGYALLAALANTVGRNVTAGLNCQYADANWAFEGPTITVAPSGSSSVLHPSIPIPRH